jgi:hypothetical protein
VTVPNKLILYIGYITPTFSLLNPLPAPLKQLQEICSVSYEVHQLFTLTLVFIHPLPSHKYPPMHIYTVPVLQSCLSLLISKSMFKGVSQCIPAMSILYFGLFNPSVSLFLCWVFLRYGLMNYLSGFKPPSSWPPKWLGLLVPFISPFFDK